MPQMKPMNWLTLFMFFCMILKLMITFNFFSHIPSSPKNNNNNNKFLYNNFNWKW